MNENQIAQLALERLQEMTGLTGAWKPFQGELDGILNLYFGPEQKEFYAEVKKELRHYQLNHLLEMARRHQPLIVIAENIFPTLKEILRDNKIAYLDTAGNIFVHTPDRYVWIQGNKAPEKKVQTNRAFTRTGLKTVFYFMLHEDAINKPYRKLAEETNVALGNITNVMEGLKKGGFILQINQNNMKLQNKKTLLDKWVTGYGETLKPAIFTGKYKFGNKAMIRDWKALNLFAGNDQFEWAWGGEPAAETMTNYLVPKQLTVYTNDPAKLARQWTLIPLQDDQEGDIYFYQKFWKDDNVFNENMAPPLLVYTDLLLTDDPRCQETATMIYDKYLKDEFDKY